MEYEELDADDDDIDLDEDEDEDAFDEDVSIYLSHLSSC